MCDFEDILHQIAMVLAILCLTLLLIGLTLLAIRSFSIIENENKELERYEAVVTEQIEYDCYYIKIGLDIYILYTESFEYEIGDTVTVVIVEIRPELSLAVPYIEYVDNLIDGYVLEESDECGGICWNRGD